MKRKSNRKGNSTYLPTLFASILFLLFGLAIILYRPLNQTPEYDALEERETVVESFYVNHHSKRSDDAILKTSDGNKFYILGEYEQSDLYDKLRQGEHVQIKYYERKAFYIKTRYCIEEIVVNNEKICTYQNDDLSNTVACVIVGCIMLGVSFLFFWGWRKSIKKAAQKHRKLD